MKQKGNHLTEIHLIPFRQKLVPVKYLTRAFYEQLSEEEVIDTATGSLLGIPLGWFNVHDNNCPTTSHFHILWVKGDTSLRVSIGHDDWQKRDQRYRKERAKRITHRNELGDLLALLLAPSHRYDSKSTCVNDNLEVLELSGPLYVSTGAGQNPLQRVEHTRQQLDQDREEWERWTHQWKEENVWPKGGRNFEGDRREALDIQRRLSELGVQIAHPALYKYMDDPQRFEDFNENCGEYSITDGYALKTLTRDRIRAYPPTFSALCGDDEDDDEMELMWGYRDPYDPPLRWHVQEIGGQRTSVARIMKMTATSVRPLRVLLAEQAVEMALQQAERSAFHLASHCNLLRPVPQSQASASCHRDRLPDPAEIHRIYLETKQQLDDYTRQWARSYEQVSPDALEQLFVHE